MSGEDMQLSASDNMTLTAGKQLDVGVQKDFTLAPVNNSACTAVKGQNRSARKTILIFRLRVKISPLGRHRTRIFRVARNWSLRHRMN